MVSGHVEHTAAYASPARLRMRRVAGRSTTWQVAALLLAYAGVLELGQIFVPGRHAGFDDRLFSATGTIAGVLVSAALLKECHLGGG
jgi:VanZ family protein